MEPIEYEVMAAVEDRHWWYSGMRAIAARWIEPILKGKDDLRILDAGCGTGANVDFFQRYGATTGIDVMPQAIEMAVRRAPGRIVRASVVDLPFADQVFDLVTSFEVLYHRAVIDVPTAVHEMRRVMRPGGYCLIRLPAYQWLLSQHDISVHARERYTAGQVRRLLNDAGLHVLRLGYCNSLLFPLAMTQRLLERVQHPASHDSALLPPARPVNMGLRTVMGWEARLQARGLDFPWGLSVLALAQRGST